MTTKLKAIVELLFGKKEKSSSPEISLMYDGRCLWTVTMRDSTSATFESASVTNAIEAFVKKIRSHNPKFDFGQLTSVASKNGLRVRSSKPTETVKCLWVDESKRHDFVSEFQSSVESIAQLLDQQQNQPTQSLQPQLQSQTA